MADPSKSAVETSSISAADQRRLLNISRALVQCDHYTSELESNLLSCANGDTAKCEHVASSLFQLETAFKEYIALIGGKKMVGDSKCFEKQLVIFERDRYCFEESSQKASAEQTVIIGTQLLASRIDRLHAVLDNLFLLGKKI